MTAAVRIRDLRYRYRGTDVDVLRMGSFDVDAPGLVAVVGQTGVGKTTLMELLAGTLREPYHGSMQVLGVELRELRRDADRQRHLRRVGLIPQDFGLLPGCTVGDILHRDLTDAQVPVAEHGARVGAALERVGMLPFAGRNSEQLSGGQRQRVAIARTLARDVDLIIADEPTANLDPEQAESIMALFEELAAARPVIIVTHDMGLAARCARIVVLRPLADRVSPAGPPPGRGPDTAARRRQGVTAAGGMLVLALATAGSTLAVRATNAHRTAHPPAVVARSAASVTRPVADARAIPQPAPASAAAPRASAVAPVPSMPAAASPGAAVQIVQVVNRTPLGGQEPPPPAPGVAPPPPTTVTTTPAPAPAPSPRPVATAPYFQIAGQSVPVCTGGSCAGTLAHESDWSPGVPSYYDGDGSIIGNRHGLDPGVEVDLWNGTALTRYQVLGSVTVENWGVPGPTSPPPGTSLQLGGIDQANVCGDPSCAAPYYTTYVFLAALG